MDTLGVFIIAGILLYFATNSSALTDIVSSSAAGNVPPPPPGGGSSGGGTGTGPASLAAAIAQEEGWNIAGSVAQRNNNPGNVGGPTATFATPADGWNALENQINLMLYGGSQYYTPAMTLRQAGLIYSNGDPNWAANVASIMGISQDTTLAAIGAM